MHFGFGAAVAIYECLRQNNSVKWKLISENKEYIGSFCYSAMCYKNNNSVATTCIEPSNKNTKPTSTGLVLYRFGQ